MADEQVGNNSWQTMTPGSAMAGQLQQILTQKRLEARQAMMDQIHAQDVASQIRDRDENARTNAEIRESNAENRHALAGTRFLAGLGDEPAQVDPDTAAKIRQYAPTRIQTTPAQNTLPSKSTIGGGLLVGGPSTTPTTTQEVPVATPEVNQYLGSSSYQKQHTQQTQLKTLFDDPSFDNLPILKQVQKISEIYPDKDPAEVIKQLVTAKSQQAPGHLKIWSEAQQKMIDAGPIGANDKTISEPRPSVGPAEAAPTYWDGTEEGPDGQPIKAIYRSGRGEGAPTKVPFPPTFRVGGKAGTERPTPLPKPVNVSGKTWGEFLNAKSSYLKTPEDKNVNDLYTTQAKQVISESTRSPLVKAFLSSAWDKSGARQLSADELMSKVTPSSPKLSDSDRAEIRDIWGKLRSNQ